MCLYSYSWCVGTYGKIHFNQMGIWKLKRSSSIFISVCLFTCCCCYFVFSSIRVLCACIHSHNISTHTHTHSRPSRALSDLIFFILKEFQWVRESEWFCERIEEVKNFEWKTFAVINNIVAQVVYPSMCVSNASDEHDCFTKFMWKRKKLVFIFCVENKNKIVKLFGRFVVCRKIVRQHHRRSHSSTRWSTDSLSFAYSPSSFIFW